MRNTTAAKSALVVMLWAGLLAVAPGIAEEKRPPEKPTGTPGTSAGAPPAQKSTSGKSSRLTIYVPPDRGSVGTRTGGGTRGHADAPRIAVLAPDHIGLTTRAQPTLAWYLSADSNALVELTLIADGAVEPLAVKQIPGPLHAGIHLEDLSRHGVTLAEGTTYDWYVALVLDPNARDEDVIAGGAIQRHEAKPALVAELAGGEPSYRVLARNGIWYDAIGDLSVAIAAAPASTPSGEELRAERAGLLEQVGVAAVALYDREGEDASMR